MASSPMTSSRHDDIDDVDDMNINVSRSRRRSSNPKRFTMDRIPSTGVDHLPDPSIGSQPPSIRAPPQPGYEVTDIASDVARALKQKLDRQLQIEPYQRLMMVPRIDHDRREVLTYESAWKLEYSAILKSLMNCRETYRKHGREFPPDLEDEILQTMDEIRKQDEEYCAMMSIHMSSRHPYFPTDCPPPYDSL